MADSFGLTGICVQDTGRVMADVIMVRHSIRAWQTKMNA
jgi:hypothetical protein